MTEPEYRQDDLTDQGYCPKCGEPVTTVFVDGAGWCPDHGRVWCEWTPRVPLAVSPDYDNCPDEDWGEEDAR